MNNAMIEFRHVSKSFSRKGHPVLALQDINLSIERGDIFGIIGYSGAGKSTLLRLINRLETPGEGEFQKLSPGGAISYVEVPNMQDNLEAVMSVLQFIYDNIMYAELNTKSDYCQCCGYDGEIRIVEDDGKLVWECPKCGNRDQNKLNVARRTCGYIGTQFWNQGRTQEIKDRVLHL